MCWSFRSHISVCAFLPKAVERLVQGADSGCPSEKQRQTVLNCARLLTRVLPYIFEDADWRGFFWSTVPGAGRAKVRLWSQNAEEDEYVSFLLTFIEMNLKWHRFGGHGVAVFRVWTVQPSHRHLLWFPGKQETPQTKHRPHCISPPSS